MFERFTDRARQVVVDAQDEARQLKHDYIGLEHLLLGLLRVETGPAREMLDSAGVNVEDVRACVVSSLGAGTEVTAGQIPYTPRAKKALELALREALARGEDYIGPEHILFGLTVAAGVSGGPFATDGDRVRKGVARILSGSPDRPTPGIVVTLADSGDSNRRVGLWSIACLIAIFGIGVLVGWAIWGH